jgi:hypothetical protein
MSEDIPTAESIEIKSITAPQEPFLQALTENLTSTFDVPIVVQNADNIDNADTHYIDEYKAARQRLLLRYKTFLDLMMEPYGDDGSDQAKLRQAAEEGLLHAVQKFTPNIGFKFSTYITWHVRQSIDRARSVDDHKKVATQTTTTLMGSIHEPDTQNNETVLTSPGLSELVITLSTGLLTNVAYDLLKSKALSLIERLNRDNRISKPTAINIVIGDHRIKATLHQKGSQDTEVVVKEVTKTNERPASTD